MTTTLTKHKLTSQQYHLMAEAGILAQSDRVELIYGEIIDMSPIGRKHSACVARLTDVLVTEFHGKAIIWVQNSIHLDDASEPQPDLVLLKSRPDFYEEELPKPSDILLIIEVADSTISYDRDIKMPLYAAAGIGEFWLVDVNNRTLTSYILPAPSGYRNSHCYRINESIPIQAFPDQAIAWSDIFGHN